MKLLEYDGVCRERENKTKHQSKQQHPCTSFRQRTVKYQVRVSGKTKYVFVLNMLGSAQRQL